MPKELECKVGNNSKHRSGSHLQRFGKKKTNNYIIWRNVKVKN